MQERNRKVCVGTDTDRDTTSSETEVTAEQLARLAQSGSLDAFAELVNRYHGRLFNFLLRKTGNWSDAEELAQESFVRAWERIERYDDQWRFSTWLFTIGSRLAVSHHRANKRSRANCTLQHQLQDSRNPDPAEHAMRRELTSPTWDLAGRILTESQLTALWLRYAEGLSMREISQVTGKSQVSVRVTLFRARDQLATQIMKARDEQAAETATLATAGGGSLSASCMDTWVMEAI